MLSYRTNTKGVTVTVRPLYLDEPSDAVSQRFMFGYYVHVGNNGEEDVQILRDHWFVHDADGRTQENELPAGTPERPTLAPGDSHEYGNYCVIKTFEGTLEGSLLLELENGERFRANVPLVLLRAQAN